MAAQTIPPPAFLQGHEKVVLIYDHWPAFHDSEVISIQLDRRRILFGEIKDPRIELVVHCMDTTSDFTVKHRLVHFEFRQVSEVDLKEFNHQNVLFDLQFEELPLDKSGNRSFKVDLNTSFGLYGAFVASTGKVISVDQCDEKGNPINES